MMSMIFNNVLNNWKKACLFLIIAVLLIPRDIVLDIFLAIAALVLLVYAIWVIVSLIKGSFNGFDDEDYEDFEPESETSVTDLTTMTDINNQVCIKLGLIYPGSSWQWVCCPEGFASKGGIARIKTEGTDSQYMDVDLTSSGEIYIHKIIPIAEGFSKADKGTPTPKIKDETLPDITTAEPSPKSKPKSTFTDEEFVTKWYNIIFKDPLLDIISGLNSEGYLSLYINGDGKAFYVGENGEHCEIIQFENMPAISIWPHIIDKLTSEGLFAEERDSNLFVSWPS